MDDDWAWLQTILDSANTTIGHRRYSLNGVSGTLTASISGTVLTVTAESGAALTTGMRLDGAGLAVGTRIISFGTGTGGTGTYNLNISQTISSEGMTAGNMSTDVSYTCTGSAVVARLLKNADGTDPFGGTCTTGHQVIPIWDGPNCWDGTNLWSPGGYKHLIPAVWDSDFTGPDGTHWVCPTNYYYLPPIEIKPQFSTTGFSDYGNWRLSSDTAKASACGCTIPNGLTWHADWDDGWNNVQRLKWETNGIGTLHNTPHELNSSQLSGTESLITGTGGPLFSPQVDEVTTYSTSSASGMLMAPSTKNGPKTMNMHQ
jgi:hypothetical protein